VQERVANQLRASDQAKFLHAVGLVHFNGLHGNLEHLGNFLVRLTASGTTQDVAFTVAEWRLVGDRTLGCGPPQARVEMLLSARGRQDRRLQFTEGTLFKDVSRGAGGQRLPAVPAVLPVSRDPARGQPLVIVKRALLPVSLILAIAFVVVATIRDARQTAAATALPSPATQLSGTSRPQLTRTVEEMTARIATAPKDGGAVIRLADALIRLQRVNNDGRAVITAEEHLRAFLKRDPSHYDAQRMLAAVLLSQHRFGEAIAQANKTSALDPRDAWNYGSIGDGYIELGDYERAFAAYDRMGQLQPGPPAYARTSHALEIKGDLAGALEYMQRAADGTWSNDPESQAWHYAQLGELHLQRGRLGDAKREFERAAATFPNHPLAMTGLAKVKIAVGDLQGARLTYQEQLARVPTPDLAATIGDLSHAIGDATSGEQYYQMAEQIERAAWGNGVAQPQALARFFADRNRKLSEAVTLAEDAAKTRTDIFTMDALAWAYFKAGRLQDARQASSQARRTGSKDARILYHAAEILAATGESGEALRVLSEIPAPEGIVDVLIAREVPRLHGRLQATAGSR